MKNRSFKFSFGILLSFIVLFALFFNLPLKTSAKGDLDEIVNYEITVDVNDNATLTMLYHIDWKVLDSTSDGPLSWVLIGIPNDHYVSVKAKSDCIKKIKYSSSNGSNVRIDLDRNYKAGEVVPIEFELVQDYMYQMNMFKEGETVYRFTPGWFDDINVDNLTIRWNSDKIIEASPAYDNEGQYLVWNTSLSKGQRYPVQITYKNDAFSFDTSKEITVTNSGSSGAPTGSSKSANTTGCVMCVFSVLFTVGLVGFAYLVNFLSWVGSSGFKPEKKLVRTVIQYHTNCPNCGAPRPEGKELCAYCGTNMIKSKTKLEETDKVPQDIEKYKDQIMGFRDDGKTAGC